MSTIDDEFDRIYQGTYAPTHSNAASDILMDMEDLKQQLSECQKKVKDSGGLFMAIQEQREMYDNQIKELVRQIEYVEKNIGRIDQSQHINRVELDRRLLQFSSVRDKNLDLYNKTAKLNQNIPWLHSEANKLYKLYLEVLKNLPEPIPEVQKICEKLLDLNVSFESVSES